MEAPAPNGVDNAINLYKICTDFLPIVISFIAVFFGVYSSQKANKNTRENIRLQADIEKINNIRHWRREKIYNIADELYELAGDYWLSDEDCLKTRKCALAIRVRLEDLEENSMAIGLDITKEIQYLQGLITGGDFESLDRKALSPCDDKFLSIRQNTQLVKSKLSV